MVSYGAERQANAFRKSALSFESVDKMDCQQYRNMLKMCLPVVRGPENRHGFASFEEKNSNSFLKFNPFTPQSGPNNPLFPHQNNVPLVHPCLGFVSPGVDADLQPKVGRAIESLVNYSDVKPHQRVAITGKRGQTAHRRQMILLEETVQNRRWNSRAVPAASVRARLRDVFTSFFNGGPQYYTQYSRKTPQIHSPVLAGEESSDPSARWREEKARDYFYKSSTQKAYEEVPWDFILHSKIQPPESTVEVLPDPVSWCFTKRRYSPGPEITSGCVGAVNFEDIDNADVDLIPLNHMQTSKSCYTTTTHTPDIPGYTGKVHWSATHPANSNLPSTTPSIIAQMHGYIAKHRNWSQYNHQEPFSQMSIPVSAQNSFNKREGETITV
ncbi:protein SPMIP7 [Porphyrio hochstetteri]